PISGNTRKMNIFLAGAFGGLTPQLMRIAGLATGAAGIVSLPPALSMEIFCGGMLIYALVGGFLAHHVLQETTFKSAFFVGIAAPALIGNFITAAQDARDPHQLAMPYTRAAHALLPGFTSPAFADERADPRQEIINKILDGAPTFQVGPDMTLRCCGTHVLDAPHNLEAI
ncbi:MAG: hypothetical protein WAK55_07260, partial [Xanthobacteraceae bacterium]